ncbi:MAG: uncharacterized protein QOI47_820, partial [Actinomycetota bacterium]|nr:uncharacterized protein [Actinomycetota bacterium]
MTALPTAFGRLLRGAGVEVTSGSIASYASALDAVGIEARDPVYWAGRATLVHRPEDIATYDAAFRVFWDRAAANVVVQRSQTEVVEVVRDEDDAPDEVE